MKFINLMELIQFRELNSTVQNCKIIFLKHDDRRLF